MKIRLVRENGPPTAIGLDNLEIAAGDEGAVIGNLEVIDPDPQDDHRFALSDPRFVVENGVLRLRGRRVAGGWRGGATRRSPPPIRWVESVTRVFPIHTGDLVRNPADITLPAGPAAVTLDAGRDPAGERGRVPPWTWPRASAPPARP
ncbi:MAG: hypothetical protein U5R48_08050 [Gammaproteobacteria bacterium]|nr:hypothetical protein [Gammaproteobacteria bacterium]